MTLNETVKKKRKRKKNNQLDEGNLSNKIVRCQFGVWPELSYTFKSVPGIIITSDLKRARL